MNRINVSYLGQPVGVLAEARGGIVFEYDAAFIASGHELSPLHLPLGPGLRARGSTPVMRLPGLFEDSLPDAWGERVMLEAFRQRNTPPHAVTPLMKLAYVGHRAMGALVYEPALSITTAKKQLQLDDLYQAALQAETHAAPIDLNLLAEVGSSAGGAQPKALLGLSRENATQILAGADDLPSGHEAWMIKFDTSPDGAAGALEQAYALMARAAGLDVAPTRLLETRHGKKVRRHFATRRFDREGSERIHHHSLAGLYHIPGGDLSYEILLRVTRRLTRDEREVWRAFRRAVFNVLAGNRDDHGKNHGFLYRDRQWTLGPAYDLTFRSAHQLPERGLSIHGERASAGTGELLALARSETLDVREANRMIEEVQAALAQWRRFADEAGVAPTLAAQIAGALGFN